MKQSRFTDEQIIGFLKQADAGMSVKELCRSGGFSQPTFYKWRSRFGGMEPSDAAKLANRADSKTVMAQQKDWFDDYNSYHPHSALGYLPPTLFREKRSVT